MRFSQEREMDKFVFTAIGTNKIRMDIWLKGCPEPSTTLNLDVRDAENIRQCLDMVLSDLHDTQEAP
jgi:hypothetical protein